MNFEKNLNVLTTGEYFLSGIFLVLFSFYFLLHSTPQIFNEVPLIYSSIFLLEVMVFLILFIMSFIIYYQITKNKEFFDYDQIGSKYNIFRGKIQVVILTALFTLIVMIHLLVHYIIHNFSTSMYLAYPTISNYYEFYVSVILILLLAYLYPYILVLLYNIIITKYKGKINKKHLGIPVKTLTTILNLIFFVFILVFSVFYMMIIYNSYIAFG